MKKQSETNFCTKENSKKKKETEKKKKNYFILTFQILSVKFSSQFVHIFFAFVNALSYFKVCNTNKQREKNY